MKNNQCQNAQYQSGTTCNQNEGQNDMVDSVLSNAAGVAGVAPEESNDLGMGSYFTLKQEFQFPQINNAPTDQYT